MTLDPSFPVELGLLLDQAAGLNIQKQYLCHLMEKDLLDADSPLGRLLAEISAVKFDRKPYDLYDLFFTSKGIIAALIFRYNDDTSSAFAFPFGMRTSPVQLGTRTQNAAEYMASRLASKGPEGILQDNESNFIIFYSDIKSILIRKGSIFFHQELMLFFDDNTEYKFTYPKQLIDKSPKILKELLPDKVSII